MASNNNGNMFDSYGITKMLEMISDNYEQNQSLAKNDFAEQMLRQILEVMKVGNAKQLDKKDIQAAFKDVLTPLLKSAFGGGSELTNYLRILQMNIELMAQKQAISAELLANMMSGGVSLGYSTSEKAIATGMGNKPFNIDSKTAQGSETAKMLEAIFGSKISKKLDSVTDKILAFFGEDRNTRKTRSRQFIDDLAEGLGRSKWVGGALMDLIRLASFFAANWLKQFGPIGKALAVGVIALAPIVGTVIANILTKALVNGLTNVFKTGLLGLGTLLKAAFFSLTKNGLFKSALQGNPFAKEAAVSKGNLAVGSFLAAGVVGKMAYDTWKEGGVRNKSAGGILGVGALSFAATGIAALIGGSFAAAVAPIALPIAAIATGIGLIVKFFPQIMDFFRFIGEKLGLIAGKDKNGDYVNGSRTLGDTITGTGKAGEISRLKDGKKNKLSSDELAAWELANTREAVFSNSGLLLNAGQLTQENASKQIQRYMGASKENENKFLNNYDLIELDGKRAREADFQTDLITERDGKKYAVVPKGTSKRMDEADRLRKEGGETGVYTLSSGLGTAGSYDKGFMPSSHQGKEHFRTVGAALDFVVTDNGVSRGFNEKDAGYITKAWGGGEMIIHGDPKGGILGRHGHFQKAMTAEDRENWDAYQEDLKDQKRWVEATKQTVAIKIDELKKAEKDAKEEKSAGGKDVTAEEQKLIDAKKAELAKYEEMKKTMEKATPEMFFTGNEAVSSVLKDTVIFAQYQKSQP